jgi:hypothetical protein
MLCRADRARTWAEYSLNRTKPNPFDFPVTGFVLICRERTKNYIYKTKTRYTFINISKNKEWNWNLEIIGTNLDGGNGAELLEILSQLVSGGRVGNS